MTIKDIYNKWVQCATYDPEIIQELKSMEADDETIAERFYSDLQFGTGGLRGGLGAGSNRMNVYTVKKATKGLSIYLNELFRNPSVAIAFDSRKNSLVFAEAAAEVFAANGVRVYIFNELTPTPMLSFAIRTLKTSAGIVITASHNPAEYNGYKVYGNDGCQITLAAADKITECIRSVDIFKDTESDHYDSLYEKGLIQAVPKFVSDTYFNEIINLSLFTCEGADLRVVYSPLNGTGNKPVKHILKKIGIHDIVAVPEQENPDSTFKTCPYPNPEEESALRLAIREAYKTDADIVLATDPDCDRVGTAVKYQGAYVQINGNQMGILLFDFICSIKKQSGMMPERPVAIKTIVTSEMAQAVADSFGVELINVLTGFKFIGENIGRLEEKGEEGRFVFGFEESYGYLAGSYVRDKDAVLASMLICQMTAYYKQQGKTLVDVLNVLYKKYGFYYEKLESYTFKGESGMETMREIMHSLRIDPPAVLGGLVVQTVRDYLLSREYEKGVVRHITLPSSDVVGLFLANGSSVIIRPSGTEPKLKIYYSLKCADQTISKDLFGKVKESLIELLKKFNL